MFFRIGGPHLGKATVSLQVNSDDVILDDIWAWRADHGNGVGWTQNTADTGVIVNGDNVSATGLFVEHYQKFEVIWNGENGSDIFFQNEMPYDVPSQAAWMSTPTTNGYAAVRVVAEGAPLHRLRHGGLQLLQPGRRHLRRERVRSADHAGRADERSAHGVPGRQRRKGRHLERHQRHRRLVDHRQPGRAVTVVSYP